MSFIYSQALEGGFSRDNCSDTDACAPSSGSHTPKLSLSHDGRLSLQPLLREAYERGALAAEPIGSAETPWFRNLNTPADLASE